MTSAPAPFVSSVLEIEKDWIDYNGHLNMAYYNVLFDRASDEAFEFLGMGAEYAKERRLTTYTAEIHVCYVRELHLGDRVTSTFQMLDHDEKRFHVFQELHHRDGWLAATSESLTLHVDMTGPRVCRFPADILANVEKMRAAHTALPVSERIGRPIGIRRRKV
ncbi:thioesterase family protein [Aquamicrobium sp. LC103]|uniref:thioesterase family protein n=1 Tax=Aquamicrobium sp. LC103 TaxID=1120658 RepID=UPI00063EB11A|nr:thioesterase family protein [Aquamicrobium sp. LC103]TKT80123.1 thioesterase [Aquamicrobium sp. LC103]